MSLALFAVSDEQASALRSGRLSTHDLHTPYSGVSGGGGDVTYLGCGCVLTVCVVLFFVLPSVAIIGWRTALVVGLIAEGFVFALAWQLRAASRRRVDAHRVDPLSIVPDDSVLDLGHWHGLHFLLTGSDWEGEPPANFLLLGGDLLPESDRDGYGPPRIIAPAHLPPILNRLESSCPVDAAARLGDASAEFTIYPGRFRQEDLEEEWLQLRTFIAQAADRKASVVIQMG